MEISHCQAILYIMSISWIKALFLEIKGYLVTCFPRFSPNSFRNLTIVVTRDCSISAPFLLQVSSCLQHERYRAAEFIAADRLNDGIPQTSEFAVEPGFVATGPILLGPFFVSSE